MMTLREFVGAQARTCDMLKFDVVRPDADGVSEKLTVDNFAELAEAAVLQWSVVDDGGMRMRVLIGRV